MSCGYKRRLVSTAYAKLEVRISGTPFSDFLNAVPTLITATHFPAALSLRFKYSSPKNVF